MKKLSDSQRKWALTACLASVLSFNMVLSLSGSNFGMASFASSAEPRYETVKLQGKNVEVKIVEDEDGKLEATIPEKLESGWCYQCGEKVLLPKNVTSLAAAIKDAQKSQASEKSEGEDLDEKPSKKVAKKDKRSKVQELEEDDEEQQEEAQENPDFVALRDRCEKKSQDDSKLRCFTTGLTKLLKNKKKVYDRDEVLDLYRSEIEPGLRSSLADISDLVPNSRRSSRYEDEGLREDSTRRSDAQGMIEDMVAQISGKYTYLRERLTKLAANAALKNQESAQQKLKIADQKMKQSEQIRQQNPQYALAMQNDAMRLQQEGYARMSAANQMANDLGISLYDGLDSAAASNLITGDQFDSLYYTNYGNVVQEAIRGMAQNPLTYVLQNVTLSDGTTVVDQNGQAYTVTAAGRGQVMQSRVNGHAISIMTNSLTPADVVNSGTPRIATLNGAVMQPGTATIQVMQGVAAPVNQTNVPTLRLRGQ